MPEVRSEDGLHVVGPDELDVTGPDEFRVATDDEVGADGAEPAGTTDSDLESLRDEFVDAFNGRDLEAVLGLVDAEVECPDIPAGDGADVLAEELEAIWERSPAAILTRAFLAGAPCAVAWLPDEDGCWSRAALVTFDAEDGALTVVALPDDAAALDAAEAEEPRGEELDEWTDWSEWDSGEETPPQDRR